MGIVADLAVSVVHQAVSAALKVAVAPSVAAEQEENSKSLQESIYV